MSNKINNDESNWGDKKLNYYSKNKRDKEEDDDFLEEEEEAKKIQMEKLKKLHQAELLESDDESIEEKKEIKKISLYSSDEEDNKTEEIPKVSLVKGKLNKKNLLNSKIPEKIFTQEELSEFSQILKNIKINADELNENILPIEEILKSDDLKVEKTLNYFNSKKDAHMLYVTYMAFYTYYKSLGKINDHHPVIKKMFFLKSILNSDKNKKDKIFDQIDKTLQLIQEKKNLEDPHEETEEDQDDEDDLNEDLELNEENEDLGEDVENYEDDLENLDEDNDVDDINEKDLIDFANDYNEVEMPKKKKNKNDKKKIEKNENLLKQKRNKPESSILDIDFNNVQKEKKNINKENILVKNKIDENLNDFVKDNLDKLNNLKNKKEKIVENNKIRKQEEIVFKNDMGTRLANKNMLKSRGLYRKRKQHQGNSKLHNREKFFKKEKLRKNMVKTYEGKPEVYMGETTGIRRDLIRSTKFK